MTLEKENMLETFGEFQILNKIKTVSLHRRKRSTIMTAVQGANSNLFWQEADYDRVMRTVPRGKVITAG